jgi:hypothetical protein
MLAKMPEHRPTLDEVESCLRDALSVVEMPPRFAEGSSAHIILPRTDAWYLRWLMVRRVEPELTLQDPLGRPVLPAPPFKLGWACLGAVVAAAAGLMSLIA